MNAVLQKIIADSGIASRREAERMIRNGAVKINGKLALLGDRANPEKDVITIKGKPLPKMAEKIYIKFNKPVGYTCTNRSFPGEQNIFQLISLKERLFSIGRLDKDSRGIILLTNDGSLAQDVSHPRTQHEKIYEVKTYQIRGADISDYEGRQIAYFLTKGVEIGEGDGVVKAKRAEYLQNNLFIITLNEGKKRQIRRMFGGLKLRVADLQRTNFAGIGLGGIKEGEWRNLSPQEVAKLKKN